MQPINKVVKEGILVVGSLPDIDSDFSSTNRHRIFSYMEQHYENVARICNFTFAHARSAVRKACTALGIPREIVDALCKIIDQTQPLEFSLEKPDVKELIYQYHLEEAIEAAKFFAGIDNEETVSISALPTHLGVHAAAIVIAPTDMKEFVPLMRDKNSEMAVAMYDMHGCEEVGLIKYDFLGLAAIDIVYNAASMAGIDIEQIPHNDQKVFEFLSSGTDTYGIFQLEKKLTKQIMQAAPPKSISDIGAITSVIRPGPMHSGFHKVYIAGNATHPIGVINEILQETKGVLLYQEQLMNISQSMAGFTEIQADDLRQGIGKKKKQLIDKYRDIFINGSVANGYKAEDAAEVYKWFEASAEYAFNKSHAIMYSVISYYCAWLRYYYPLHFWAAFLNAYIDSSDKLKEGLRRIKRMGFKFLPPNINKSDVGFTVQGDSLLYGLNAIQGIGLKTAELIVQERGLGWKTAGEFSQKKKISNANKTILIKAGCLDEFGLSRNKMIARIGEKNNTEYIFPDERICNVQDETEKERGIWERDILGLAITKNPLEDIEVFHRPEVLTITDLEPEHIGNKVRFCCVITKVTRKVAKNAKKSQYIEVILSDPYNDITGMIYEKWIPDTAAYIDKLNVPMFVTGWLNIDTFKDEDDDTEEDVDKSTILTKGRISIQGIEPAYVQDQVKIHITMPNNTTTETMKKFKAFLDNIHNDKGYIVVIYYAGSAFIPKGLRVQYTESLVKAAQDNYGSKVEKR